MDDNLSDHNITPSKATQKRRVRFANNGTDNGDIEIDAIEDDVDHSIGDPDDDIEARDDAVAVQARFRPLIMIYC